MPDIDIEREFHIRRAPALLRSQLHPNTHTKFLFPKHSFPLLRYPSPNRKSEDNPNI
ncbi:hypothetical protein K440DRAFT_619865, partial [Wilcoxina mikolae CBS 423.85]